MKKIQLILFTVFLSSALFSCSPDKVSSENTEPQACCGHDSPIIPPPPQTGG